MWDRFLRWCYPDVGSQLPLRSHRDRLDLRPYLLILVVILVVRFIL